MKSLDMMRNGCHPKFPKIPVEDLDKYRSGVVPSDITKDFKVSLTKFAESLTSVLTVLHKVHCSTWWRFDEERGNKRSKESFTNDDHCT